MEALELGKELWKTCRKIAEEYLGPNVNSAKVHDSGKEPVVLGIGHCHMDSCWLLPFAETKRKAARSWSHQCDWMDPYPELNLACSQALLAAETMEKLRFVALA
ncbi:hypothetical protein B0T25DRAFT_562813 [Lasiosphaeria hispida]|uniref:Glycoside hydrolase family 38 N-terminal domain-containing protein n=1 Tax=Lasiosphaeria hispida TaxID=260671 RepID=A0AAJ0HVT5_9PEZI|nr:hypothetical protein B0T25DRAFT_562813 [Lasiosphaeria hispida]